MERRPTPEAERTTTRVARPAEARARNAEPEVECLAVHRSDRKLFPVYVTSSGLHICQFNFQGQAHPSARVMIFSHTECLARHGLGVIASHEMDLGSWAYTLSLVHSVQYMAHVGPPYRHTCSLVCASVHGFSRSLAQRTKTSTMRVRSAAWCHRPKDQASIYIKQVRTNNRALLPSGLLLSAHAALSPAPCSRAPSLRSCPTRRTA